MLPENTKKLENQKIDEEKPGMGQHYCVVCARYLISAHALKTHLTTKEHKKRKKTAKDIPYSHEEAERAGGLHPTKIRFTDSIYAGKFKMADLEENKKVMD